jgi:hypothetical protein
MARRIFLTRLAQLAALPFVMAGGSLQGQSTHKSLKIVMRIRRSNQGGISFLAWSRTLGSRPRSANLFAGRGSCTDAKDTG